MFARPRMLRAEEKNGHNARKTNVRGDQGDLPMAGSAAFRPLRR
jgi:hypothetical protein